MEKRIKTLEVLTAQRSTSLDRLERAIADLRSDVDRKIFWVIGILFGGFVSIIGLILNATKGF